MFGLPTGVQREKQRQNHPVDLVPNSAVLPTIQRLIVCMTGYQVDCLVNALKIFQIDCPFNSMDSKNLPFHTRRHLPKNLLWRSLQPSQCRTSFCRKQRHPDVLPRRAFEKRQNRRWAQSGCTHVTFNSGRILILRVAHRYTADRSGSLQTLDKAKLRLIGRWIPCGVTAASK